jgi:rare lipoprotein A (peptidoglycan hydrolase)
MALLGRYCPTMTAGLFLSSFNQMGRRSSVAGIALTAALALWPVGARGSQQVRKSEVGLASYYGPGFNGQPTASGEVFDERNLVAASRTLPLGSVVRVTNLENGRTVRVRIIDRGPYGKNRRKGCIIDVSKGAARRLHFIRDGTVHVRVLVEKFGARDNGSRR